MSGLAVYLSKGYEGYKPARKAPRAVAVFGAALLIACAIAAATGCQLPASHVAKVAGCSALYDACFVAARLMQGEKAEKMAAYMACRAQVDSQCLDALMPPPDASAAPSASPSAAPGAEPSAVPSSPSSAPSASVDASVAP